MCPTRSQIPPASAALIAAALLLIDLAAAGSVAGPIIPSLDAVLGEWISPVAGRSGRAICVRPDPGGAAATAVRRLGFEAAAVVGDAACCCGLLPFGAATFDFALVPALDRARVPARVVLEMERVLRPGRVGVVLRRSGSVHPDRLMRAVAPVASLLRYSDVVGARAVNGSAMVVFRKRASDDNAVHRVEAACGGESLVTKIPLVLDGIMEFVRAVLVTVGGGVRSKLVNLHAVCRVFRVW